MSAQPVEPRDVGGGTGPDEMDAAELAEAAAVFEEWRRREAAGETRYLSLDEVRRLLGLTG